ncbi:MBOAT family protein [Candidatus Woesearchaeota archaeon]|nr:MBOAT family protein [Candidatus Woesearchaeota archaeon]
MILFQTLGFIKFFIIVFLIFWMAPKKLKTFVLLFASYIFYISWDWRVFGLIIVVTLTNYLCGIEINRSRITSTRKILLTSAVVINLSILGFFKYYNFFIHSFMDLVNNLGMNINLVTLNILLPVGISFYTFQSLSYTIDVYRGRIKPTKDPILFSLFVAYFPQLIAGPIERAKDLIPELSKDKKFSDINFIEGTFLFAYGFFKKVIIADTMAIVVDIAFKMNNPSSVYIIMGILAFALQIYCDFSGYSHMARGISCFFGIKLSRNFNLPYLSTNPSDFWKRWHITLSSWVKDYIYIPLGGNRRPFFGAIPLFVTMALMGLWHGAAWNFVIWGIYWFIVILIYRIIKNAILHSGIHLKGLFWKILSIILMFIITCYSWLIFRAGSLSQVIELTRRVFHPIDASLFFSYGFIDIYLFLLFIFIYEAYQYTKKDEFIIIKSSLIKQLIFYLAIFLLVVMTNKVRDTAFIYFQF